MARYVSCHTGKLQYSSTTVSENMRIQIAVKILMPRFPNTNPKLVGIQKSPRIRNCNTYLASRGNSDLNLSSIYCYVLNVFMGNSDLNSSSIYRYVLNVSMGNSDLNSSSIHRYVLNVLLRFYKAWWNVLYLLFRSKKVWYSILLYRSTKNTINSAQPLRLNSTTCGRAGGLKKDRLILLENLCRYWDSCGMRSNDAGIHGNTIGNACHLLKLAIMM